MRKLLLLSVAALGLHLAGSTGAAAQQNPLLGKWKLVAGDAGCYTELVFTPTTQTLIMRRKPDPTTNVTYNAGSTKVYVIGDTGIRGAVGYTILSPTRIKLDSWVNCIWQRE